MHALHRIDPAAGRIGLAAPLVRGRQHEREIKQKSLTGAKTMAMTKREFLIGAAAASGGVMLSRIDASGQAGRRVIDAHTHWYPAQWVDLVQNEGEAAGARIGRNDRGGIKRARRVRRA